MPPGKFPAFRAALILPESMLVLPPAIAPERERTMRKTIAIAVFALLGACTVVEKTGEEITIEHAANQFFVAEVKAENYCQTLGRHAQHVMTSPRQSSLLFVQSSVSVFRCVLPAPEKK